MKTIAHCSRCAAAGLALLLSPVIVALGVPFACGVVGDILARPWLAPAALVAAAAIAIKAWRRRPTYATAAKSIT